MKHQENLDAVYREHGQTVYRFLVKLCGDPALAEDLTQDTFLRAIESVDSFDASCKMTSWLCQIAKNLYFDHLRYQKRHQTEELAEENLQVPARSLEECLENADLARQIRSIVHELAEPYKEVFLLRVYAELPYREIGTMFGHTEVWGRVTFLRAKDMVLQKLTDSQSN